MTSEVKRIALLTDGVWPFVVGGMQKHSFYLCKYFARKRIYVELFHTEENEFKINLNSIFSQDELNYIRTWDIPKANNDNFPGHYIRAAFQYSKNVFDKLQEVLLMQPDIQFIYAKGLTGWYLLKNRSQIQRCPPIAINVHGYEYFQKTASLKNKLEQYLLRPPFKFVNSKADFIFSYGGKITEIILENIQNSSAKIIEIPTGIEKDFLVSSFRPSAGKRRFVFIGRNERRKGIKEINFTIKNLVKSNDFEFHFIGDITSKDMIVASNIVYHGVLRDRASIAKILQQSDILVCPSYSEGMPNVILEGMASGCAVIASDVGAVNIQVGPENGWLIEPGSRTSLLATIKTAINSSDECLNILRQNSIKKVIQNFLWENVIDKKIESIENVLRNWADNCN